MAGVRGGYAHMTGGHGVGCLAVYLQAAAQDVRFARSQPGYIHAITYDEILRRVVMINRKCNDD